MLLAVNSVHKGFDTTEGKLAVLRGVDLSLASGEKLALTGESGSGKSTLLYLIGGLDAFDAGSIAIEGERLELMNDTERSALRRQRVGIVFQQFNLVPSLNVYDNMRFYARLAGREDDAWNSELIKRLGLSDFVTRYPEQLSGGQQQRVAIGRTLAARPRLILADEPTGNLDEETSNTVVELMAELTAETGAGLLMVTHSHRLAGLMGRQVHLTAGRVS